MGKCGQELPFILLRWSGNALLPFINAECARYRKASLNHRSQKLTELRSKAEKSVLLAIFLHGVLDQSSQQCLASIGDSCPCHQHFVQSLNITHRIMLLILLYA